MAKSTGIKNLNIAVFISGTGSNFINLIKHSLKKNSKYKIKLVVSNNPNAKGLKYAEKYKIQKKIINYKNLNDSEKNVLIELDKSNIKIICLAGYMKILTANFIKKFKAFMIYL